MVLIFYITRVYVIEIYLSKVQIFMNKKKLQSTPLRGLLWN